MVLFDPDYAPTRRQAIKTGTGLALLVAVMAALVWAGWLDQENSATWVWSLFFPPAFVLSLAKVRAWLERGRRLPPGVWRTSRAVRLNVLFSLPVLVAWQFDLVRLGLQHWHGGDVQRLAVVAGVMLLTAMILVLAAWNLRCVTELTIDARGIDARSGGAWFLGARSSRCPPAGRMTPP